MKRLLVVRCQTGDDDAYRELIGRFGPRLRYYLLKLVGRIDRADDLAQEVWLDVLRQLHRLKDAAAFTTWLYRIAHGKAMLEARRNGRAHATIYDPNLIEARQDENFSAEDAARIHAMLDQLETTHREVLVLRFSRTSATKRSAKSSAARSALSARDCITPSLNSKRS